jgi:inward rectifier potassium channel
MNRFKAFKKHSAPQDLGLTTQALTGARFINSDGSFNVTRRGLPWWRVQGFYERLITMPWLRFYLIIATGFIAVNFVFGAAYFFIGKNDMMGVIADSEWERFEEDVFFSAQTMTTVGYGRISPKGIGASSLAAFESLIGLLGFALSTGLLFARFARPRARILFSPQAVIAPYQGGIALMFRIANERSNQLIEVDVQVSASFIRDDSDGSQRDYHALNLERRSINFFPLSWTIVHPIDERSPLFGVDQAKLVNLQPEFFILIKGFDDIFSQTVHARYSYQAHEIVWGARFKKIFHQEGHHVIIDLDRLGEMEPAVLASSLEEHANSELQAEAEAAMQSETT